MNSSEKISEGVELISQGLCEIFTDFAERFRDAIDSISDAIGKINYNKKLTKNKFCKLLQSYGIQRNEINKIVKDNKEPYTVKRLYIVLKEIKEGKK